MSVTRPSPVSGTEVLDNTPSKVAPEVRPSPFRLWLANLRLRSAFVWNELELLAFWVETEGLAQTTAARSAVLEIEVGRDGAARVVSEHELPLPPRLHRLWRLVADLGIRRLELDSRLESNQVTDIVRLLVAYRGQLRRRSGEVAGRLRSVQGLAFACTATRLDGATLSITYSYCMTRFSHLVRWFKARQAHFSDHRALFRAAPRLAAALSVAVAAVAAAFLVHGNVVLLLVSTLLAAAGIFAAIYSFVMAVGSVEYDNEQKTRELELALEKVRLYADRIRDDLERARVVQDRLVPEVEQMPHGDRIEWAGLFVPADEVGGDAYDVVALDDDRVALLFADVSGHGLSAALVTVIITTSFHAWAEGGGELELADLARTLNHRLRSFTPPRSFAALVLAIFDVRSGLLTWANCGHNPEPWLVPAGGGPPRHLDESRGTILGAFADIRVEVASRTLAPGDVVVLATDGLTEARDGRSRFFGSGGVGAVLAAVHGRPLATVVEELLAAVSRHASDDDERDDRAVLAFRVRPDAEEDVAAQR